MRSVAAFSKGHNYLRIFGYSSEFCADVIVPFCRAHLYKVGKVPVPGSQKQVWKVTHVFARSNHDKTEYRIPCSLLKELISYTQYRGYNPSRIKMLEEPEIQGAKAVFKLKPGYEVPRAHQDDWIGYQLEDGAVKVNNAATGEGKALANNTPVRTVRGWVPIGQLKVNDLVMAPDGSHTYVTGVYPQGVTDTFKLTTSDGRIAFPCPEHQWEVKEDGKLTWEVMTTWQLVVAMKEGRKFSLPLTASERNPDRGDIIKPYTIGYTDRILGVRYLEGSHHQRLSLLKGLLDRGGVPSKDGSVTYYTEYGISAKMVQDLVWSLGGIAKASFGAFKHRVHIQHKCMRSLFTSDEILEQLPQDIDRDLVLPIVSITPSFRQPTTCISVEHHTKCFVIKDYLVTHNTYMALFTMVKLGVRTLITIQPRYITTWINDIAKVIELEPEDILIWENASLPLLGEQIEKGLINPKIIILPMTRISGYLRNNRKDPDAVCLDKIFKQINAGYRIIDEGHESFHEVCLSLMYGNIKKFLLLSATLKADDPFMDKMYRIMLPIELRLKEPDPENYIDIVAYLYHLCQRKYPLKTVQFGSYNDMTLEQSILRTDKLTNFYFQIANKAFKEYYLDIREEGTKCLFFFSRINMCEAMLALFQKEYPDMDFVTYLGSVDKKTPTKYLEHEIVITTPGSCGTGKDIPGLVTTICFHTVFSQQRNKQMIGRLRNLLGKFGGRITPRFIFPLCNDLSKHQDCYRKRKEAFASKEKSFKLIESSCALN